MGNHVMAVYRNVNTDEIIWEAATVKNSDYNKRQGETRRTNSFYLTVDEEIQLFNKLVLLLRRNDGTKWNDVFRWFDGYWWILQANAQNETFLQKLILAVTENIGLALDPQAWGPIECVPLCIAANFGNTDSILKLVQGGADVDGIYFIWTPLMTAALKHHVSAVRLLLEKGANRNLTDRFGKTALQYVQPYAWEKPRSPDDEYEVRRLHVLEILQQ